MKRAILAALAVTALAAAGLAAAWAEARASRRPPITSTRRGSLRPVATSSSTSPTSTRSGLGTATPCSSMNVNGLTAPGKRPVFASGSPAVGEDEGRELLVQGRQRRRRRRRRQPRDLVLEAEREGRPDRCRVTRNGKTLVTGKTSPGKAARVEPRAAVRGVRRAPRRPVLLRPRRVHQHPALDTDANDASRSSAARAPRTDFFAGKNVSSIVLELPAVAADAATQHASASGRRRPSARSRSTAWVGLPIEHGLHPHEPVPRRTGVRRRARSTPRSRRTTRRTSAARSSTRCRCCSAERRCR